MKLAVGWGLGPTPLSGQVDLGDVTVDATIVITLGDQSHEFTVADIVGRLDTCFRCDETIRSQLEVAWIGNGERSDCPESEDGAPHEPEEPM